MTTLASFHITLLLEVLVWAAMIVLNLWIWQKTKAQGNLLMLIGAGCLLLAFFIWMVSSFPDEFVAAWLPLIGSALVVLGFYFTVKTLVAAQLGALKGKLHSVTAPKQGGGSPPSSPPPT